MIGSGDARVDDQRLRRRRNTAGTPRASGPVTRGTTDPIATLSTTSMPNPRATSSDAQQHAEFVGGARDVGHHAPVAAQLRFGEQADRQLRVADVEDEDHVLLRRERESPRGSRTVSRTYCRRAARRSRRFPPRVPADRRSMHASAARQIARRRTRSARSASSGPSRAAAARIAGTIAASSTVSRSAPARSPTARGSIDRRTQVDPDADRHPLRARLRATAPRSGCPRACASPT